MKVAETASCLGEDEGCGGIVPWREEVFEIEFAAPHSEIAKLWGGGTEATDVVALQKSVADDVGAYLGELLVIDGEGGAHDAVLEWAVGYVDLFAVEVCALTVFCMEQFVGARQIDHAHLHVVVVSESYADGALSDATGIVCRSVDRVDDPCVFVRSIVDVLFLADEAGAREKLGKSFAEKFLYGNVGRGDDV